MGHFWGHILKQKNEDWFHYIRGGFCGTVAYIKWIQPGNEEFSHEGFFIGQPKPFVDGKYQYIVYYSDSPVTLWIPSENIENRITTIKIQDYYELTDEFSIRE